jgi:hypothetical protein
VTITSGFFFELDGMCDRTGWRVEGRVRLPIPQAPCPATAPDR